MRGWAFVLLGALALPACSKERRDPVAEATAAAAAAGQKADLVPCAIKDEKPKDCAREITAGPDGPVWIIRRSDGGFRRFVLIDNGTRIATADGAQEVRTKRNPESLEVFVADEYYRFADAKPN